MSKTLLDAVLDASLDEIKDNGNLMTLCSSQPTTRTQAVTTFALADVALATGDYTVSNGDTNGRKLNVAEKAAVDVDTSGTGTHVAIVDGTRLLVVTTTASVIVGDTQQITFPTWDIEVADPT